MPLHVCSSEATMRRFRTVLCVITQDTGHRFTSTRQGDCLLQYFVVPRCRQASLHEQALRAKKQVCRPATHVTSTTGAGLLSKCAREGPASQLASKFREHTATSEKWFSIGGSSSERHSWLVEVLSCSLLAIWLAGMPLASGILIAFDREEGGGQYFHQSLRWATGFLSVHLSMPAAPGESTYCFCGLLHGHAA